MQKCEKKHQLSYRQFISYKPFYVTEARSSDRNTCACWEHANISLLSDALSSRGLITTKSLSALLSGITCDTENTKCMQRVCTKCCYDEPDLQDHNPADTPTWEQWEKQDVVVGERSYKNWVKKKKRGTVGELTGVFNQRLNAIASHQLNWLHQVKQFRHIKENIHANEMVLHIDFSENYACKLNTEIQAFHFGGNRQQATMHTGVAYSVGGSQCYATISQSLRYERAVWAHIKPVIDDFRRRHENAIDTLHVLSDGPATQYRNRSNCFLMSSIPYAWGFKRVTWNFSERSHGKGAPDGVGGVLKRKADMYVLGGSDLQTPRDLYEYLQKSSENVTIMWIEEEQISTMDEMLPPSVRPVTGISSTNQVLSFAPGKIFYRDLRCTSLDTGRNNCHKLHQLEFDHVFPDEVPGDKTSDDGGPSAEVSSVQPSWPTTASRAQCQNGNSETAAL
ncbi:uncharacterized protein LOC113071286 isoform X2 [Carassius auratus]|uniref:Uncharacterized protein LOC113071286 isoform X2 n=1 Tax=Carassius auratus TaxID=7957 RepID=A0A6P6MUT7_CARAU|nr:uncharacterized protein LOC113071286 isoform X2 [Carassius auratus]